MSLFTITWRTQVTNLLPEFKRILNVLDFLTALCEPLKTKAAEWVTFDDDVKKRGKFNGQGVVLAAALNNIFGVTVGPFILIETVENTGITTFIYNTSEGQDPTYIYNEVEPQLATFIYNSAEINDTYDFVVNIPVGIHTAELERQITAETNTYKLSGKKFITDTY